MTILLFLIILLILVLSHEFGHFIVAKMFKIRVDEFAFGFPPRLFSKKFGETEYSFNALPLGGYVKIYGEDPTQVSDGLDKVRSFNVQARWKQALVIVAGVVFNLLLAWVAVTSTYLVGAPALADNEKGFPVKNAQLTITEIMPDSPAEKAGLKPGDVVISLQHLGYTKEIRDISEMQEFMSTREGVAIEAKVKRGELISSYQVIPATGIVEGKPAIGVSMDMIGVLQLPLFTAITEGFTRTVFYTKMTAVGIYDFLTSALFGQSDFSQVTGPVGIVNAVGDAAKLGVASVLLFTALISINLAVINVLPFPALDGGRLMFIIIESIIRRPIPARVANMTNLVGFALLMLLMVLVTVNDVGKLF